MRDSKDPVKFVQAPEPIKLHNPDDIGNFAGLDAESF